DFSLLHAQQLSPDRGEPALHVRVDFAFGLGPGFRGLSLLRRAFVDDLNDPIRPDAGSIARLEQPLVVTTVCGGENETPTFRIGGVYTPWGPADIKLAAGAQWRGSQTLVQNTEPRVRKRLAE